MKKMTLLSLVFTIFFLQIDCLKANSWEKPKEMETLQYRIDVKINALQKEKVQKQAKLEDTNAHLSDKQKDKIEAAVKDLDSRVAELNISKADIKRLENDIHHIYSFSQTEENNVVKKTDKEIVIQGVNDALLIHEIRHISLWLQTGRDFRFSRDNFLKPIFADGGSMDEVKAYQAQYAFEPNSLPESFHLSIEYVNIEFISNIQKRDGTFAYPDIRKLWENNLRIAQSKAKLKQSTAVVYSTTASQ